MKGFLILCSVTLLVALVSASPLALEKSKDEKPLSVVDVPAGTFDPQDKAEQQVEQQTPVETLGEKTKDVEKVEGTKDEDGDTSIFGFRLPSIVIIRRPAIFQDPFAGWESPFFGGFNRRPILSPKPVPGESEEKDREQLGESSHVDEQKQNETVLVNNMIQRMHQQINSLFSSLFRPDAFAFPRPTIPRPFFSRPSFFAPGPDSSEEDSIDFDKLPPNYKNSTSETKVVDGQVVTVNKTVHKISGNNSNGFFHFSVIKVRPSAVPEAEENVKPNPEITEESKVEVATPEKKPEPEMAENDPKMNEVDRPEGKDQKLTEVELKSTYETQNPEGSPSGVEEVKIIPIPEKLILAQPGKIYSDLSSDIRVNNLMENSPQARFRALYDPDEVEIFEV